MTFRRKITIVVLALYWIVLLVLSHRPIPQLVYQAQVFDKWLHFLAFLNLIFLLWFSVRPESKVHWRSPVVWLLVFVTFAYGAVDEWTQPYFGRTKDIEDFLANALGVSAGLLLFTFMAFWQSLLAVLAITIFGITNLAKANLSKLVPVADALFHFFAYAGLTLVWIKVMNPSLFLKSLKMRLLLAFGVPLVFLFVVKAASLLLGRHFALTDLFFASLAIFAVSAVFAKHYLMKGL
jgi:VanZ family protein